MTVDGAMRKFNSRSSPACTALWAPAVRKVGISSCVVQSSALTTRGLHPRPDYRAHRHFAIVDTCRCAAKIRSDIEAVQRDLLLDASCRAAKVST
jgi:hypothetical protein